jgi:IS5 family transposase
MKQISLFVSGFRGKPGKVTKREKFLGEMDQVIPWSRLVEVIKPHYPEAGNGRPPMGLEKMLWGHTKVRYKGLLKNALQFFTLFALANVYHARRKLLPVMG